MQSNWVTLYDVSRNGIGIIPWFFAVMWLVGLCAGGIAFKAFGTAFRKTQIRFFLPLWLAAWALIGGVGVGNVFYQYAANYHALKADACSTTEGSIVNFHRQNPLLRGDSERFVVNGHPFEYSSANLGGGGLRDSASFRPALENGLYVRIWYRDSIICRLDARKDTNR